MLEYWYRYGSLYHDYLHVLECQHWWKRISFGVLDETIGLFTLK